MDTPFPQKKAQRDALRLYVEKNFHHRPQDRTLSDTNVISMETLLGYLQTIMFCITNYNPRHQYVGSYQVLKF